MEKFNDIKIKSYQEETKKEEKEKPVKEIEVQEGLSKDEIIPIH